MVAASGRGGQGELIRSTGHVGPDWTNPWMPVPDGAGGAACAPQAASTIESVIEAMNRFI